MFSRIDKLVREVGGHSSLHDARKIRERDVVLMIGERTPVDMVRFAVALALRTFAGNVVLEREDRRVDSRALVLAAESEAVAYQAQGRLLVDSKSDGIEIGLSRATGGLYVDAAGWTSAANRILRHEPAAPPASAMAAAVAFAKLFASMLGAPATVAREQWVAPLLDFGSLPYDAPALELGRIGMIGGGATGGALGHVLRNSGWSGELQIADFDRYDEANHETTLLVSPMHGTAQAKKAATLASLVTRDGLVARGIHEEITASSAFLAEPFDALVVAVDNAATRRVLDAAESPLILNGGLGGNRLDAGHVLWSAHFAGEASLSALYPEDADPSTTSSPTSSPREVGSDDCSRVQYDRIAAAAPFLALAGAAHLAAGLAQRALGLRFRTVYLKLDLFGLLGYPTRRARLAA